MKSCDKLGKFIDLEIRLDEKSTKSNITEFGSTFVEKSTSEVYSNFRTRELQKIKLKLKFTKSMIRN